MSKSLRRKAVLSGVGSLMALWPSHEIPCNKALIKLIESRPDRDLSDIAVLFEDWLAIHSDLVKTAKSLQHVESK